MPSWNFIAALLVTMLSAFGTIVGLFIHPLLGAGIAGLGGYIIFKLGMNEGVHITLERLQGEFNITLNNFKSED
tara:strand:- start:1902 stop:2123 length:222 start_codon:yes stop_codon:yes gene_type:complete